VSFRYIIIMLLFLFSMPVMALGMLQKPIKIDYNYCINTARKLSDSANYNEVQKYYQKAIHFSDSTRNWKNLILTNHQLIELYIKQAAYAKADSLLYINEVLRKKHLSKNKHLKKKANYAAALLQFEQGAYKQAFKKIEKPIKLINKEDSLLQAELLELKFLLQVELNLKEDVIDWINEAYALRVADDNILHKASYHYYLGYYFFKIKDYPVAKKQFAKSLEIRLSQFPKKHPLVTVCKFWLGKIHLKQGELQLAKDYINKTLQNTITVFGEQHPYLVYCYEALAQINQQQKNNEDALAYYQLAIKKLKTIFKEGHPLLAKLQNNLAHLHQDNGNYDEANKYYNFALLLFKQCYDINNLYYINCLNNIALLNRQIKKHKTAINNFKEAISIAEKYFAKHDILQKLYYNIALLYCIIGDYNAMNIYSAKIKRLDFEQHIEFSKIHFSNGNYQYAQNVLTQAEAQLEQSSAANQLKYYYWKAQVNYLLFEKEATAYHLDTAVNLIQTCNQLIKERRKEIGNLISYNEDVQPVYKLGIHIFNKGLILKKDSSFIDLAFQFINESKANTLLHGLSETNAMLNKLPKDLIQRERTYQQSILLLEKLKQTNINQQDSLSQKLLETKSLYDKFKIELEKKYPLYYELKYENFTPGIKQVQNKIETNTAVLEYFIADSLLYLLHIEKNSQHFYALPKPKYLLDTIDMFMKSITTSITDTIDIETIFKQFTNCGRKLYQNLIQKPLEITQSKQLIIIPDKQLNYVPFDLLLTKTISINNDNYKTLPYLLNQYSVGYLSSSSFLTEKYKRTKKHLPISYIGYAPKYETKASLMVKNLISQRVNIRGNYTDLPNAREAVIKIDSMLNGQNGQSFINETATKVNFIANKNKAKIQHFAMHGTVDEENPLDSHLIFSDDLLTIADLYTLNIETDLAVLTACNTGTGFLQEGEGVMSLSRAFTYAGCPSLIMSLWSLPDEQTAIISECFFQYLKEGLTKHQALRQAKLKYLQTEAKSNRLAHPFFWAGLVATGNMDAVFDMAEPSSLDSWLIWFVPLSFLILILFWLKKIRNI